MAASTTTVPVHQWQGQSAGAQAVFAIGSPGHRHRADAPHALLGEVRGLPITKGKLSVDLKYLIDNGKLDAQNQVYVNQLTFGGKVDSPDAVKLPILFAIGLLTNSKGKWT